MKKFTLLLLVLAGMVCTASATDHTVYIKLSASNWLDSSPDFWLYTYGDVSEGDKWHQFTLVRDNIYSTSFTESPTGIIILRKQKDSGANWSNEWNRSGNITTNLSETALCYEFYDGSNFGTYYTTLSSSYSSTNFWIASEEDIAPSYNAWKKINDTKMTNNGDFTYTLEVTGNILDTDTYGFKVLNDAGDWLSDPDGLWDNPAGNYGVTCTEAGTYTITYTYNVITERATTSLVKTGSTTATYKYKIDCHSSTDSEKAAITDSWWNTTENQMTVTDGIARLNCLNKTLDADSYYYKVVKQAYNGETELYTQWNDQQTLTISEGDAYNVTFYFNISTKTPSAQAIRIPTAYYYVGGNDSWSVGDAMTKTDGVYSITLSGLSGHSFVIVPDFAIENGAVKYVANEYNGWDYAIRPASSQTINTFVNYSGDATTTNSSQNWAIDFDNVTFTYNSNDNTWSAVPYIVKDFTDAPSQDGSYLTTFSNTSYAVAIPDGVTAYYADKTTSGSGIVKMVAFENGIAANTGAFLKASEEKEYHFTPATTTDNVSANNLFVAGNGTLSYDANYYRYVFATQDSDLGFYKIGSTFSTDMTGKAYLEAATSLASTGARVAFVFDDETTAISEGLRVKSEEFSNAPVYNLAGQRVAQPTKGLYIVNGKKVIMK